MGNYRFRLSDMMPNAWFYKLKAGHGHHHAARKRHPPGSAAAVITTKPDEQQRPQNPRKSYYFTRDLNLVQNEDGVGSGKSCSSASDFPEPPRKSAKQRTRKRNSRASPKRVGSSAACSCRLDSVWAKSGSPPECFSSPLESTPEQNSGEENVVPRGESFDGMVSTWCSCRVKSDKLDSISDLHHLPPIIAKPAGFNDMIDDIRRRDNSKELKEQSITVKEQKSNNNPARKACVNSPGVKLRVNSPRIASKKIQSAGRRSVSGSRRSISDSCAVVKTSMDPQKDFRESMMEMIVENNLRASKDLEDLLACYLSLNSDEYHALIIKVFKQIWFDLSGIGLK